MRLLTTVFSGLHRFTYLTASTLLQHSPDIAVYAKILTGGLLPLSATLASESIFNAFLSDRKVDALLHGHSYTAHPVGCSVALEAVKALETAEKDGLWATGKAIWDVKGDATSPAQNGSAVPAIEGDKRSEMRGRWSFWSRDFVEAASRLGSVKGTMAMGTVCAIELEDREGGESSSSFRTARRIQADPAGYASLRAQTFLSELRKTVVQAQPGLISETNESESAVPVGEFAPFQIHSRPLGNVIYFMTSFYTKPEVIRAMEATLLKHLGELQA